MGNAGRFNELRHQLNQARMAADAADGFLQRGDTESWSIARTFIIAFKTHAAEALAEMHRLRQDEHGTGHAMPNPEPAQPIKGVGESG